jgi:hypothetical protein
MSSNGPITMDPVVDPPPGPLKRVVALSAALFFAAATRHFARSIAESYVEGRSSNEWTPTQARLARDPKTYQLTKFGREQEERELRAEQEAAAAAASRGEPVDDGMSGSVGEVPDYLAPPDGYELQYGYQDAVEGKEHVGTRYSYAYDERGENLRERLVNDAKATADGDLLVTAFYNPSNPSEAVLQRGVRRDLWFPSSLAAIFAGSTVRLLLFALKRGR